MTQFVVGAAVGIVGAVVGWLLGALTDSRRRQRTARVAARMVFFELGLNLGVAGNMAGGDVESGYRTALSRTAWDQYAGDLAWTAPDEVMTLLTRIYSTDWIRLAMHLAKDPLLPTASSIADARAAFDDLHEAVQKLGPLAGETQEQVAAYLEPFGVD